MQPFGTNVCTHTLRNAPVILRYRKHKKDSGKQAVRNMHLWGLVGHAEVILAIPPNRPYRGTILAIKKMFHFLEKMTSTKNREKKITK